MSNSKPDWLFQHEAEERQRRDRSQAAKQAILAGLKKARVATVTLQYDGEGDSGQISAIEATNARGKSVPLPKGPFILKLDRSASAQSSFVSFEDALDAFAWEVLRSYHDGFENNEGGFGTINIDVRKGTITIDHNDRIIEVCRSVTEV